MTGPTPEDVERVLLDDAAVRVPDPDPQLEALHRAILLEQVFGVTLSDPEIDPDALATPAAAYGAVSRHPGGR